MVIAHEADPSRRSRSYGDRRPGATARVMTILVVAAVSVSISTGVAAPPDRPDDEVDRAEVPLAADPVEAEAAVEADDDPAAADEGDAGADAAEAPPPRPKMIALEPFDEEKAEKKLRRRVKDKPQARGARPKAVAAKPRSRFGATLVPLTETVRDATNLPAGVGLCVEAIEEGSPAALAGLQADDIVTRFGDQIVCDPTQVAVLVAMPHQAAVRLRINRNGTERTMAVTLGPDELAQRGRRLPADDFGVLEFFGEVPPGFRMNGRREPPRAPIIPSHDNDRLGAAFGGAASIPDLEAGVGLSVVSVTPGGPAAAAGLKPGDIVTRFGDQILCAVPQIDALVGMRRTEVVTLTIHRGGTERRVKLALLAPDRRQIEREALADAVSGSKRARSSQVGVAAGAVERIEKESDGETTIVLHERDGRWSVEILSRDGARIHAGTLDTPHDRKQIPARFLHRVERVLEEMQAVERPPARRP